MALSLASPTNLPRLVNNQKNKTKKKQKKNKLDNETSESVDESLRTEKTSLKFITKKKNKINNDSLFISFPFSKCVKIARLATQLIYQSLMKAIKQSKRKKKKTILFS